VGGNCGSDCHYPDVLDGGIVASGWTGVQSEFGLIASIAIYALLCWTIPQIAANVASGGLSMSVETR
jgi:hypothetical protein